MMGSAVVHFGLVLAFAGLVCVVKPIRRLRIRTRARALALMSVGLLVALVGAVLPAPESRVQAPQSRLDEIMPAWQFREFHETRVAAPPAVVFEAIRGVRADEIRLFQTLTWIRRGGRPLPESILNAGTRAPLIDVALRGGFVRLADEPPRELVIGTIVAAPPGARAPLTPELFRERMRLPGYALAAMNFNVVADTSGGSYVTTETRVFATNAGARRRFAAYWRLIYPGSALIRRGWLRAIERRAEGE